MVLAVGLTLAFVIGETIAGTCAHSLARFSDAGHNFAGALALGFSAFALWIAGRPATRGMTYGFRRVGILAALVNAVSLVIIALLILFEAAQRWRSPGRPHGWLMVGVAAAAVGVNLLIASRLHGGQHDLNVRSAYLHMLGDALSAAGVVAAGFIIALTGNSAADPIVSCLIAGMILWSSWGILRESVNVLLEGTPQGLDLHALEQTVRAVDGVCGVHHLHVWTVGSGMIAASLHVVVAEQSVGSSQQVLRGITRRLQTEFHVNHATVQIETEPCAPDDTPCDHAHDESAPAHTGHEH